MAICGGDNINLSIALNNGLNQYYCNIKHKPGANINTLHYALYTLHLININININIKLSK